jgi:protocatechuate 3,4-dioxygenase beta subunit
MRRFMVRFLWVLLISSLTACGQGLSRPQERLPELTNPDSVENDLSVAAPTPTAPLPETGGKLSSQEWVCASGELPPSTKSARAEMGPGPGIPASTTQGERLAISAVVYTSDCQPLSGVAINLWQTDPRGVYGPGHGTDNMQCCYYLATVTTDENGRFDILTVKPGAYQGEASPPPAHIHVEILHPDLQNWQTEIVFTGDPQLPPVVPQGMIAIPLEERSLPEGLMLFGEAEIIAPIGSQSPTG